MLKKDIQPVCTLCNNRLSTKLIEEIKRDSEVYSIYLCEECNVGITSPAPTAEELSELYSAANYRSICGKRFNPFIEYLIYNFRLQRKRRIKKYIKKGRILDIGCGRGLFLDIMRRDGWNVTGVEFNKETASYATEIYRIHVITGDLLNWNLPDESLDVVTIYHVLEHVPKPLEIISACKKILRKGGLCVIAIPNIASLQASIGKKNWFHLDIPYHLYHFSEEGLCKLLKKNDFRILKIRRFDLEYNLFGWLQTLLNLSGIKADLFYNLLKNLELRRTEYSILKNRDLILNFSLLPLYFPLSCLLSAFESFIIKGGGTIEVYAVKE